jgi:hypothetical protein
LLQKSIVVRSIRVIQGEVFIYRTRSGYTNLDVLKNKKETDTTTSGNPVVISFRKVRLEDVKFSYQDSLKKKVVQFKLVDNSCQITRSDSSNQYRLTGPVEFEKLALNPAKGSFLENKAANVHLNLEYNPLGHHLSLHSSVLEFTRSNVNLSGDFYFSPPGTFVLHINSNELNYEEGISLLPRLLQQRLGNFKIEKPLRVTAVIDGKLTAGAEPKVDVTFEFIKGKLKAYSIQADRVTVDGIFSNHVDNSLSYNDRNSVVRLNRVEGILHGLPSRWTASIRDLTDPSLRFQANVDTNLPDLTEWVDPKLLKLLGGKFVAQVQYSGKLNEFLDTTRIEYAGSFLGQVEIRDGSFRYVPRNQSYEKLNLSLDFNENHLGLKTLSFMLNKSPVVMEGEILGFVPFISTPAKKGYVNLKVHSPLLDLTSFLSKPSKQKTAPPSAQRDKRWAYLIDRLYNKTEFTLALQLDQLVHHNLKASNLKGNVLLVNNKLSTKGFKMNLGGGDIVFSMNLVDLQKPVNSLSLAGTVRHADIRRFFYAFNNFKLTTLTYQNLEGKIDMAIWMRARVDDDFNVFMPSVVSDVDFSIKRGVLLNFEPLENMSNFLFKKRDFSNVQFGEIKSHLAIRGNEIDIRKMEIESSVLRLFVEGRYSLKNKTDLSVQVPLSNLKKRDKNYKPQNVGVDSKVGPSVFLHVYKDAAGKTVIAYDPFKKHVKKAPVRSSKK